jgi:uncharacterized protein (TIGR03067 family)
MPMKTTIKIALAVTTLSILMPWALVCTEAGSPSPSTATELQRLQGSWEGVLEGHETEGRVSITITGNVLRFRGLKPTQRYAATFTLPAATDPQQLHATIQDGPGPKDIGQVVFAIFKIENGTLTLAGISESAVRSPRPSGQDPGFENNSLFRYDLRKVQPKKNVPQ